MVKNINYMAKSDDAHVFVGLSLSNSALATTCKFKILSLCHKL